VNECSGMGAACRWWVEGVERVEHCKRACGAFAVVVRFGSIDLENGECLFVWVGCDWLLDWVLREIFEVCY